MRLSFSTTAAADSVLPRRYADAAETPPRAQVAESPAVGYGEEKPRGPTALAA